MQYGNENLINRQMWVKKTLTSLPNGLKIIDVGAGECQYKKYCSHLQYVSQDFNQYNGEGDGVGFQTGKWDLSTIDIVSDITDIPVQDESFDVVLCTEVLEHVPDPVSALNEMNRILKKGGVMIITSPFCSLTHFAPYHFADGFNKYFYEFHFKRLGYDIFEITPNGNYFKYISQELIRLPSMIKTYLKGNQLLIKLLTYALRYIISSSDTNDTKSSEILCYGYHIQAQKK